MKNYVLGAICHFGSNAEWWGTKAPRCSFRVLRCRLEAQNGHIGAQICFGSTKCDPKVPNIPMAHLGSVWA